MKKPNKKQIIFGAVILAVAAIGITVATLFSQYQTLTTPANEKDTESGEVINPARVQVEKKSDDAMKQARDGDVEGGAAALDEAIQASSDDTEKYIYYSRKATLLYNSGDISGALEAGLKAYELNKSSDSAALVGQFYRESNNTTQAIEYYKKAIPLIDTSDPLANEDAEYYKAIVRELGGTI